MITFRRFTCYCRACLPNMNWGCLKLFDQFMQQLLLLVVIAMLCILMQSLHVICSCLKLTEPVVATESRLGCLHSVKAQVKMCTSWPPKPMRCTTAMQPQPIWMESSTLALLRHSLLQCLSSSTVSHEYMLTNTYWHWQIPSCTKFVQSKWLYTTMSLRPWMLQGHCLGCGACSILRKRRKLGAFSRANCSAEIIQ